MSIPVPSPTAIQQVFGLNNTPSFVGAGGFKAVYQVENESGRAEALKLIYIHDARNENEEVQRDQEIARAEREIEILGRCDSINLVSLGSIQTCRARVGAHDYIVYSEEFLPGEPLGTWLEKDPPPAYPDLLSLFKTLVGLVKNLYQMGFVHRDIKPANIMDTGLPDRRFVLFDLGIAYKLEGTQLTLHGNPPGTIRYTAPELLSPDYKDNMDFRSDLYAAALTVYVLASGYHPFAPKPESPVATAWRIMNTKPQSLLQRRTDLPTKFCAIIDRCIRKRPALRYSRLDLLEDELRKVEQ